MTDQVPPNLRAIHILEALSECDEAPTPTELNERLGLPKQTVHRLCQTLINAGLLEKHGRRLYPGQRTNHLATGLANRAAGRIGCHQLLRQVATESGETVNFVRPEPRGMNYVDRVETNWPSVLRCLSAHMSVSLHRQRQTLYGEPSCGSA